MYKYEGEDGCEGIGNDDGEEGAWGGVSRLWKLFHEGRGWDGVSYRLDLGALKATPPVVELVSFEAQTALTTRIFVKSS